MPPDRTPTLAVVSRETLKILRALPEDKLEKLRRFVELLDRWRQITDLVSDQAFMEIWDRHVADSMFLQSSQPTANRWLDIGSGAGFPAVVLATMVSGRTGAQIHCVESDGRKCAFLRTVSQAIRLPLKVHNIRAEQLSFSAIGGVDVVTARAFSSVDVIVNISKEFLRKGAIAALPRGKSYLSDIDQIDRSRYSFDVIKNPNPDGGVVLQILDNLRGP